jgi:NAD(P)H-dependent FMN reductase
MSAKFLALAASTRPDSLNKKLLAIAVAHARAAGAEMTVYDYATCETPIYRDDASQPYPASAKALGEALRAHDGLLLASPEYNWSMPGSLKNLIDWLSVDKPMPLKGKHALLMCASPSVRGGILGLNQLSVPLSHLGVHVYPHLIAGGDAESQITADGIAGAKDAAFLAECVTDFTRVAQNAKR